MEELFWREEEDEKEKEFPVEVYEGIEVRLLNHHHSLWGEKLTPSAKILARIIKERQYGVDITGKSVIELGAGAGLPSIISARYGASNVVSTDYPDVDLINNLAYNLRDLGNARVEGFCWGKDVSKLIDLNQGHQFDVAISCDIIFNTSEHRHLLQSLRELLKPGGLAVFIYTHHRTNKVQEEIVVFDIAQNEFGFSLITSDEFKHEPLFTNDTGDIDLRTTAHLKIFSSPMSI